jgi:hypothetical protein
VRAAPAVSCAKCTKESAHEHTGSAEAIRHSLRNGFTAYAALSSATNSSCHRRQRIDGSPAPGWADMPPRTWRQQRASGPHGFAVRCNIVRLRALDRSQAKPALRSRPRADAAASTASHPNVRDDHDTPPLRDGMVDDMWVIWVRRKQKYFLSWGWTGLSKNSLSGKSLAARKARNSASVLRREAN